jgi:uncharacterized protein YjbI with pentapeptide repeats
MQNLPNRRWLLQIAAALFPFVAFATSAHADIFQWEYINPADTSQGKQQSRMIAPDGAAVDAVPGTDLSYRNLTMAYLIGADLTGAYASSANLTDADLSQANLTNARVFNATLTNADLSQANLTNTVFEFATLTDADFTGAEVRGAGFGYTTPRGFAADQLYSTRSYQSHDLAGIGLGDNDLTGWSFAGQNLSNADFVGATLTDVDFTNARVEGTNLSGTTYYGFSAAQLYSTASYQARDLMGIKLGGNDLTSWNFAGQNLSNAKFDEANLTGASFREANLGNATFIGGIYCNDDECYQASATLTDADFTDAEVRGAIFNSAITLAQLYSTASYQVHDLTGIGLGGDLSGGNFAGQNLTNANFSLATLTGADFKDAEVRGAKFYGYYECLPTCTYVGGLTLAQLYSTASYESHDLSGIGLAVNDLTGGNFSGDNLTNAAFNYAKLTGVDFTGAEVRGAMFNRSINLGTGITLAQLYSTASYQSHDLSGIKLSWHDLSGANFAGQNLSNASFPYATLTGADFSHANLTNAYFGGPANLTGADFTAADARGASFYPTIENLDAVTTTNLIRHDGHIRGVDLDAGGLLALRDYDGDSRYEPAHPAIPITVDQHLAMGPGGTLRMVFEADDWDSTISFAPGIPVTLGGTLELTFADDVNLASQLGRTLDLFDWTGVTPTGDFAIFSSYAWDLSDLYTTGEVTLAAIPEPTGIVLVAAAAAFCGRRLRRRKSGSETPPAVHLLRRPQ